MAKLIKPDGSLKIVHPANGKKFTNEELCQLLETDAVHTFVGFRKFAMATADFGSENRDALLRARIGGIERHMPIYGNALFCAEKELP